MDLQTARLKLAIRSNKTRGFLFLILVALEMMILIIAAKLGATLDDLLLWIFVIVATFIFSIVFFFSSDRKKH